MNTIEIIRGFEPEKLFNKIWSENTETIARILLCMTYQNATYVFAQFALPSQIAILMNIFTINEISPDELVKIDELLTGQPPSKIYENGITRGGIDAVVELLNFTHIDIFRRIMAILEVKNPEFADVILKKMFVFADIVMFNFNDFLKTAFLQVDDHDLAIALRDEDSEIEDMVFRNITEDRKKIIKKDMDEMGPIFAEDVEEAQYKIYKYLRNLKTAENRKNSGGQSQEDYLYGLKYFKYLASNIILILWLREASAEEIAAAGLSMDNELYDLIDRTLAQSGRDAVKEALARVNDENRQSLRDSFYQKLPKVLTAYSPCPDLSVSPPMERRKTDSKNEDDGFPPLTITGFHPMF